MDDYSRHEVFHMANVIGEMVDQHMMQTDYAQSNQDLLEMLGEVSDKLFLIYQYIGAEHLECETDEESDGSTEYDEESDGSTKYDEESI